MFIFLLTCVTVFRGSSQKILLMADDSPRSVIGARMLSTIAKYLQMTEDLTISSFKQADDLGTIKKSLHERDASQAVISLLTNDTIVPEIKLYAEKHEISFIQIDESFSSNDDDEVPVKVHEIASPNPRKGKRDYTSVIPPWITMLSVMEALANTQKLDAVVLLHDDHLGESILNDLPTMLGERVLMTLIKIGTDEADCWIKESCMNMNKTTFLIIMSETPVLQSCLKQVENCSRAVDLRLIAITTDITPFDLYLTFVRALWIRPHYVRPVKEIDSIIKWCDQEDLDTDLFRIGRELEISFYYHIFSVVAAKVTSPNVKVRLSKLIARCLSDAEENSTQSEISELCKSKPEFGPYVKASKDIFFEDIQLNIYHIFATTVYKEIYLVAKWNEADGIEMFDKRELFPSEQFSNHYRIVVIQASPFITAHRDPSGTRYYTGFCIDLIKTLSEQLNFTYEIYEVPLVQYKRLYFSKTVKSNTLYGVVPELHEGNANIALANIHPTSPGELLVDFTVPFYENAGIAALLKTNKEPNYLWQFLLIIEWPVALCTLLSVLISGAMLTLFDVFSPFSSHNRKAYADREAEGKHLLMKENIWFCMMSFTLQGAGENPRNLSGRTIVAAYWISIFLLMGTYSAVLANRLTAKSFLQGINDVEQLFDQNKIHYSVVKGSATMKYFQRLAEIERAMVDYWRQRVKNPALEPVDRAYLATWDYPFHRFYHKIFQFIKHVGMPRTSGEGVARVLRSKPPGHFVLLGEASLLEYASLQHCNLRVVFSTLNERPYAMAVQQGSRLLHVLSKELRNQGTLHALKMKWFKKNFTCERDDDPTEISIKKISGMFLLMCIGLAISTATLVSQAAMRKRTAKVDSSKKEAEVKDHGVFNVQRYRTRRRETTSLPVVQ